MWEEEEVAWGTSEGRRWHGHTTVVEMVKVDEKKDWSTRLSRRRGERHQENRSNHHHCRPTLKRWMNNVLFPYPCCSADELHTIPHNMVVPISIFLNVSTDRGI